MIRFLFTGPIYLDPIILKMVTVLNRSRQIHVMFTITAAQTENGAFLHHQLSAGNSGCGQRWNPLEVAMRSQHLRAIDEINHQAKLLKECSGQQSPLQCKQAREAKTEKWVKDKGRSRERERIDKLLDRCPQGIEKDNGVTLTHAQPVSGTSQVSHLIGKSIQEDAILDSFIFVIKFDKIWS